MVHSKIFFKDLAVVRNSIHIFGGTPLDDSICI